MQKQIHLLLGERDVFQLLDGLEIREEAWRNTAILLETGESPTEFFLAEECSKPEEARDIAEIYRSIIERIRKQLDAQHALPAPDPLPPPNEGATPGFAIYIDTFFTGAVPCERNESDLPVAYATERDAQIEIVDSTLIRLHQFLAGERDFADATTVEEYIVPVDLHPDGSITDEAGNKFPDGSW